MEPKSVQRLERRVRSLESRSESFSSWRSVLFLGAVAWAAVTGLLGWASILQLISGALFLGYIVLVQRHGLLLRQLELLRARLRLETTQRAVHELDWKAIPELPPCELPRGLPRYFDDLDLVSGHSLLRLVNRTCSTSGFRSLIAVFASNGISDEEIRRRQERVREMSQLRVLRRRFQSLAALAPGLIDSGRVQALVEADVCLPGARLAFAVVSAVQFAAVALFIPFFFLGGKPWFLLAAVLLLVLLRWASSVIHAKEAFERAILIESSIGKLLAVADPLIRMARSRFAGIAEATAALRDEQGPRRKLRRLALLTTALSFRQNPVAHLLVNLLFPWDYFWTLRLSSFQRELRAEVPLWLKALAEIEVLISLAEYHVAFPDNVWPELVGPGDDGVMARDSRLHAVALVHPLIPRQVRVGNDLDLDVRERCLLITGSNMSGKSTFLRSVGVNLLLAKAGTSVAARGFRYRNQDLMTSLRLADSLEEGLSSFYAEVQHLKAILEAAQGSRPLLYLIDEIFRGTNNRERLQGSRAYVMRLVETAACGLITTHDLELSQLSQVRETIRNYHFREEIRDGKMVFSYRKAPGPCPTTNALKIMELAGLPV